MFPASFPAGGSDARSVRLKPRVKRQIRRGDLRRQRGASGGALVDGNGDGADLELEALHWTLDDGWRRGCSTGTGPREDPGRAGRVLVAHRVGSDGGHQCAPAETIVHVGFEVEIRTVTARGPGWRSTFLNQMTGPTPGPSLVDWEPGKPAPGDEANAAAVATDRAA